jgi:glutathione peroxidase
MQSWMNQPVHTLSGDPVALNVYAGNVLLIVNVASECGCTRQYEGLETLYRAYKAQGFVVLGFPSNDFGGQEPGSAEEIGAFCSREFDVTFPMFEKISIIGDEQHPLYRDLVAAHPERVDNGPGFRQGLVEFAAENGLFAPNPAPGVLWNFEKFLIGRDGTVIERFGSEVKPDDPRLTEAVEKALAAA